MIEGRVKIHRLGYLVPHPIKSAFGKFEEFFFTYETVLFSIVCILTPTQLSLHLENLKNSLFTCEAVLFSIVFDVKIKGSKKNYGTLLHQ